MVACCERFQLAYLRDEQPLHELFATNSLAVIHVDTVCTVVTVRTVFTHVTNHFLQSQQQTSTAAALPSLNP